jgi:preprotein translocase subunit SecE
MANQSVTARRGNKNKSRFSFFTGIWSELKKVVWLSRREIIYLTSMVLAVSVAAAVVLGLFDWGFSELVSTLLIN